MQYPYFTVTRVISGQLVKLTNEKFNTCFEALVFLSEKYKDREDTFNLEQIVILKYTSPYESIIHSMYSFGSFYLLKEQ